MFELLRLPPPAILLCVPPNTTTQIPTPKVPDPDEGMPQGERRYQIYLKSPSGPIDVFVVSQVGTHAATHCILHGAHDVVMSGVKVFVLWDPDTCDPPSPTCELRLRVPQENVSAVYPSMYTASVCTVRQGSRQWRADIQTPVDGCIADFYFFTWTLEPNFVRDTFS